MTIQELSKITEKAIHSLSKQQRKNDILFRENCVLFVYVENPKVKFSDCAAQCEQRFSVLIDEYFVKKTVFKRVPPRANFVKWGKRMAEKIIDYVNGKCAKDDLLATFELEKKNPKVIQIALFTLYKKTNPANSDTLKNLLALNDAFALECFDDILSTITSANDSNVSEYENKILQLEHEVKRSNSLISRLQDEFDEQLEESKREEQEKLIQQLNSSRYDCILDQLTTIQAGLRKMRRERVAVPLQINSLPALVRQLLQFVEDCGITPMQDIGEEFEISAAEAESYLYQGSPFTANDEKKQVVVVATGWEIREKDLILSPTTVREVQEESAVLEDNAPEAVQQEPQKCVTEETQDSTISMPKETGNSETVEQEQNSIETPDAADMASSTVIDDNHANEVAPSQTAIEIPAEEKVCDKDNVSGVEAGVGVVIDEAQNDAFEKSHSDSESSNVVVNDSKECAISESKPDVEMAEIQPTKLSQLEVIENIGIFCMKMALEGSLEHSVTSIQAQFNPNGKMDAILSRLARAEIIEMIDDGSRFKWLATEKKWNTFIKKKKAEKAQSSRTRKSQQVGG